MIKVYGSVQYKGGTGKTTTVQNIAYEFAAVYKTKTLMIDTDPQANLTKSYGLNPDELTGYFGDILENAKAAEPEKVIYPTAYDNLSIIPSSKLLASVIEKRPMGGSQCLEKFLIKIWDNFDYVFIDTPPGINDMTTATLAAATDAILPIQCEHFSLEGVEDMTKAIMKAQDILNERLTIGGAFLTMVQENLSFTKHAIQAVSDYFKSNFLQSKIRRSARVYEAQNQCLPVQLYATDKKDREGVVADFKNLAKELINRS